MPKSKLDYQSSNLGKYMHMYIENFDIPNLHDIHVHVPTFKHFTVDKFTTTLYKVGLSDIGIIISRSIICICVLHVHVYSLQLNAHIVARNQNHILLSLACFYGTNM